MSMPLLAWRGCRAALERFSDTVWPLGYRYEPVQTYKTVDYAVVALPGRAAHAARALFAATQQLSRRVERRMSPPQLTAVADDIPF